MDENTNWGNVFDDIDIEESLVAEPAVVAAVGNAAPAKKPVKDKIKTPLMYRINLLEKDNMTAFLELQTNFKPTNIFEWLEISTVTLESNFTNVKMHERELINVIEPTYKIPCISCNWGVKRFENWAEPQKERLSSRGRPKKPKEEKQRKKQGSGKAFSSQMQMAVRTEFANKTVFKIKVFRTGTIQIPGGSTKNIHDIIRALGDIAELLDTIPSAKIDPIKNIKIVDMYRCMTNYKTRMTIPDDEFIFLDKMALSFTEWNKRDKEYFSVGVKSSGNKFVIEVVQRGTMSRFKINIFKSGKVNFQGTLDDLMVYDSIQYLTQYMNECRHEIVFKKQPKRATSRKKKENAE